MLPGRSDLSWCVSSSGCGREESHPLSYKNVYVVRSISVGTPVARRKIRTLDPPDATTPTSAAQGTQRRTIFITLDFPYGMCYATGDESVMLSLWDLRFHGTMRRPV